MEHLKIFMFYIDALFDYEIRRAVWRKLCFPGFLQASVESQKAESPLGGTSWIFLDIQRNILDRHGEKEFCSCELKKD